MDSNPGLGEVGNSMASASAAAEHDPVTPALRNTSGCGESDQISLLSSLSSTLLQLVSNLSAVTPQSLIM